MNYIIAPISPFDLSIDTEVITLGESSVTVHSVRSEAMSGLVENCRDALSIYDQFTTLELIRILDAACLSWFHPSSKWKKTALELLPQLLRQPPEVVARNIDLALEIMSESYLKRMLQFEMGNKKQGASIEYFDGWVDEGLYYCKLRPRKGVAFHHLSGNALVVPVISIMSGILARKANIMKTPSNDPLFAHLVALSVLEIEPRLAPVLNILHWSSKDEGVYRSLFKKLDNDYVVQWGTAQSTSFIRNLSHEFGITRIIEHGPKISFEVLEHLRTSSLRETVGKIIRNDVLYWDQQACTSARFVIVTPGEVSAKLAAEQFARAFSECCSTIANDSMEIITEEVGSDIVFNVKNNYSWSVRYSPDLPSVRDIISCVDRTIIVCPAPSCAAIVKYVDAKRLSPFMQTLGYDGNDMTFCEAMGIRGASMITQPGEMNFHMPGTSHDGMYTLRELFNPIIITRQKCIELMQDGLLELQKSRST